MAGVLCVGIAAYDMVFGIEAIPDRAGKVRATRFAEGGGGCAGNAAAAIARLGGRAVYAGRFGADAIAERILEDLGREGVEPRHVAKVAGGKSSISAIMVDAGGERLIVNFRDPDLPECLDILPEALAPDIDAVLADTRWIGAAAPALRLAAAAGRPGILDAEPPLGALDAALQAASHVVFSAIGLADLTGTADPVAGLAIARSRLPGWIAVTDGAAGTFIAGVDGPQRVPSLPVDAVDTLGAGDVWHGAFALRLAEGAGEIEAVRFANVAAALKCRVFGGKAGAPDRAAVEAALGELPPA